MQTPEIPVGDVHHAGKAAVLTGDARELDLIYTAACDVMAASAVRRNALPAVYRELVSMAVNASVTGLYLPAVRRHMEAAARAGATQVQILEALELASVLGIHTLTVSLPILAAELGVDPDAPFTEEQVRMREAFTVARGNPPGRGLDFILRADPQFFAAYAAFSGAAWSHPDGLEPKLRELIYVAIDASCTHLLQNGIVGHARKAISYGATPDELLEVLELTSLIGFHSFAEGAAVLTSIALEPSTLPTSSPAEQSALKGVR